MTKKAIFTMGLPGAGKSTVVNKLYSVDCFVVIDPDLIKEEMPDYDPKHPEVHHEWSKNQALIRQESAINEGKNLIIDGTGTNVEKMYAQIKMLQAQGYSVTLLYVEVRLETAIARNASRPRVVPEEIIREKWEFVETSFEILSKIADEVVRIKNDQDLRI